MSVWLDVADEANCLAPYGKLNVEDFMVDTEHGDFTPTILPTSGSITLQGVGTVGQWMRMGSLYVATMVCLVASVNSPAGSTRILGLPAAAGPVDVIHSVSAYISAANNAVSPLQGYLFTGETPPIIRLDTFDGNDSVSVADKIISGTQLYITAVWTKL